MKKTLLTASALIASLLFTHCGPNDNQENASATKEPVPFTTPPLGWNGDFYLLDGILKALRQDSSAFDPRITYTVFYLPDANKIPPPEYTRDPSYMPGEKGPGTSFLAAYLSEAGYPATPGGGTNEYSQFRQQLGAHSHAIVINRTKPEEHTVTIIQNGQLVTENTHPFRLPPGIYPSRVEEIERDTEKRRAAGEPVDEELLPPVM